MRRGLLTCGVSAMVLIAGATHAQAAPGDLDLTFGTTGHVTAPITGNQDAVAAVVRKNGTVVVFDEHGAVAQFLSNGDPDPGFGNAGVSDDASSGSVFAATLQGDGKLVLAGFQGNDFMVERLNRNGGSDLTFGGGDGVVTTSFAHPADVIDVFIQDDGKIVAAGAEGTGDSFRFALARYKPGGKLDATFGGDGKVTTPILGGDDFAEAVVPGLNGTVVAAGVTTPPGSSAESFAVVRYLANGQPDRTFGGDGKVTVKVGQSSDAQAIVVRPDGRIVVGGDYSHPSPDLDWALIRLKASGRIDRSFGNDGKVKTIIGPGADNFADLIRQPSGKLVAGGVLRGTPVKVTLVRYLPNGTVDASFGTNGTVVEDFGDDAVTRQLANAPGDKVVVGMTVISGGEGDLGAARFLAG
jgi:uncharacterized delta-60 repeat protein